MSSSLMLLIRDSGVKYSLEVKDAKYEDFEVLGLQDPETGVRFFENIPFVLELFLEGIADVIFSIKGTQREGNSTGQGQNNEPD